MRKFSKGVVTLMMCYFFLLATLILSLGLYSGIYQQFRRTTDEIEYRKKFWQLEGGLECAYSQFNQIFFENIANEPITLNVCQTERVPKIIVTPLGEHKYKVTSASGYHFVSQVVTVNNEPDYQLHWLQGSWSDYHE